MRRFIEFSSFGNGKGELSFNKLVTFTALWCFVAAVLGIIFYLRQQPNVATWSFGFGVVGAGFGLKGYLGAAARRTDAMTQADKIETAIKVDAAEVIKALATRDPDAGYQPSGKVPRVHAD